MSKWDSPATSTINPFRTHRSTKSCDSATKRSLKYQVIRTVIQCNHRFVNDWPTEGPNPWMWYVYQHRRPMPQVRNMTYEEPIRFYYGKTMMFGPLGMGRNIMQAMKDFKRKLAWAERGKQTL